MNAFKKLGLVCLLLLSTKVWGSELAPDPFLGKWVLDTRASQYPANTCPRQMTIEMVRESRGIHYHSETLPTAGTRFRVDYTADYDGKPAIVTGSRGILLPVALKRENSNSVTATYSNGFVVMATSKRVLSDDGKVMTITTTSRDSSDRTVTNVGVYRKVDVLPSTFDRKQATMDLPVQ